jgi:tetratricopeptide (TPR) repeat protein
LRDDGAAILAWQSVLELEVDNSNALAALEAAHRRRHDWLAVQEILTRRIAFAEHIAEKVAIHRELAGLAEHQQGAVDEAIVNHYQILDLDNANLESYGELERLLTETARWHDLVELIEREADVLSALGDDGAERAALTRAADVWESQIGDLDAAGDVLENILKRDPESVPALTRLAKVYENTNDWQRCEEVLNKALALGPAGRDAADLYFRLACVARHQHRDAAQVTAFFYQALMHDSDHEPTIAALEGEARDAGDMATVADMLARREAASRDPAAQVGMALELAELYINHLGAPGAAIPLLERAARTLPNDSRVALQLADLYLMVGRLGEAAPIYEKLAEDARGARRMKEVAKYRQRQGAILEAAGEAAAALAAYEEAVRVNPTDPPTMAGLGRIYMANNAWDKAQRVYRTLVLQNIDPSVGLTKAEVYHALGRIHVELAEPHKARGMFQRGLELEPQNAVLKEALNSVLS